MIKENTILLLLTTFVLLSCGTKNEKPTATSKYESEINNWHTKRLGRLKKETGWLNLVGLFWLKEGKNTFGSSKKNDIVFPDNAISEIGTLIKKDSTIVFNAIGKSKVTLNGKNILTIKMKPDISGEPTILELGSLRWFIIKRGEKYGIRLRDLEAVLVKNFEGIERFPVDEKFKIVAKFVPHINPKTIIIPTILDTFEKEISPGKINFVLNEKEYTLEPTSAGNRLFIVFADLTSGEETYGAGRFLYIEGPDSNNNVILDFNKSYNPPCAFTKFATCPLPPEENKIRVRITAGEKKFDKGH